MSRLSPLRNLPAGRRAPRCYKFPSLRWWSPGEAFYAEFTPALLTAVEQNQACAGVGCHPDVMPGRPPREGPATVSSIRETGGAGCRQARLRCEASSSRRCWSAYRTRASQSCCGARKVVARAAPSMKRHRASRNASKGPGSMRLVGSPSIAAQLDPRLTRVTAPIGGRVKHIRTEGNPCHQWRHRASIVSGRSAST